jgi:hypothetical protein
MATVTKTVNEARDEILQRIGSEDQTDMQALVIVKFNNALVHLATRFDWKAFRKKDTLTTPDATGIVELPEDLDRVLSIHERGSDDGPLIELPPNEFELYQEDDSLTRPTFWCLSGYSQDTTSEAPAATIEILTKPAASKIYTLWYIKHLDEIVAGVVVPNLPPYIWLLIQKKALIEMMEQAEHLPSAIAIEQAEYGDMLQTCIARETLGSSKRPTIRQHPAIINWRNSRFS